MLSHVSIGIGDFDRALAFYAAVMEALGCEPAFQDREEPVAGWRRPGVARPMLFIGHPFDRQPASAGNGQMTAMLAPDRASVRRAHAAALAQGGRCEGPPGLRPQYHAEYYGAYFRDPDGNKLCVCCHDPDPGPDPAG